MSTVQSIYDVLQYRPDIQTASDDLIHIVNSAIRAISKRLYVLDSDIITDQMEVPVYAEVSYTATTFDLNNSNPATISDGAAEQFVVEGFEAGMPVITTSPLNEGPFRVTAVDAAYLVLATADSITDEGLVVFRNTLGAEFSTDDPEFYTGLSLTVSSLATFGFLPTDFWGLKPKFEPYLDERTIPLLPLPSQAVALQYPSAGEPIYYRVRGNKLYVTPSAGADYTIKGDYYKRPAAVTGDTSTIPFNELFDDLIAEYVDIFFRGPLTKTANTVQILDKLIKDGVDIVAIKHDRKGSVTPHIAVDWSL